MTGRAGLLLLWRLRFTAELICRWPWAGITRHVTNRLATFDHEGIPSRPSMLLLKQSWITTAWADGKLGCLHNHCASRSWTRQFNLRRVQRMELAILY